MSDGNNREHDSDVGRRTTLENVASNETTTSWSVQEEKSTQSRGGGWRFPRRGALKKLAATSASALGVAKVPTLASAETISDTNTATYGDHDQASIYNMDTECAVTELTTSSALDSNSTPYDTGGPVFCNWSAQVAESYGDTEINNLTVTVDIDNAGDGWNFENAVWSEKKAPDSAGFEPSFGVSVGLFIYSFGVSFSDNGTKDDTSFGLHSMTHDFGTVCDTSVGDWENTGWIRVNLDNPSAADPYTDVDLTVTVEADVDYYSSGPGQCGTYANGEDASLKASESFSVEIV